LSSYVFLVYQLLRGVDSADGTEERDAGECEGFNSAISPQRHVRRPSNSTQKDFALGPTAKKVLRSRCLAEQNEVLRFFCLDYGCQHERGEIYLASGMLDSSRAIGRCSACPICNRTYHKDFIPVYRSGVVSFLEWLIVTTKLPFAVDFKIQVSSLLMTSEYWKEIVFDKSSSSVTRTNVDCLFLSMAASGILEMQNTNDGIKWVVGRLAPTTTQPNRDLSLIEATIGEAKYKVDEYWIGFNLHPATRIRVRTPAIPLS
jgi:hypothetical protein